MRRRKRARGSGRGEQAPARMSHEQLVDRAAELDDVTMIAKTAPDRPERADRRAQRTVALWFALSALFAGAFIAAYLAWPYEYRRPGEAGYAMYSLYTPVVGGAFALSVLALSIGVGVHIKKFLPEETAVQQRQDGLPDEQTRETAAARLQEAAADTGFGGRPLVRRALLGATGVLGLAAGVLGIGGFVRNPWKGGAHAQPRITGWNPFNGETVYLRAHTGVLGEIVLVRPEDVEPGTAVTVFPYRESDRGQQDLLVAAERSSDSPVMLIRLRPGTEVRKRPGQEDFNHGDFYAFSKVCTHLGCPASEFDAQNNITLCPCHQSQFLITQAAKPVFGPASRPLPQLPIAVDERGFFIARGDFVEPVGPGFWEMRMNRP